MGTSDFDYGPIVDILEDILGDYRMHNDYKGQMSFDCPVCSYEIKGLDHGDGKGNLEVNSNITFINVGLVVKQMIPTGQYIN